MTDDAYIRQLIEQDNSRFRSTVPQLPDIPTSEAPSYSNNPVWWTHKGPPTQAAPKSTSLQLEFIVLVKNISGNYVRGVFVNSFVISDLEYTNNLAITGLLTSTKPADSDPGWVTTSTTDVVWLNIQISNASSLPFTFGTAAIQSLGAGNTYTHAVINDGGMGMPPVYSQTELNKVIAVMDADSNGNPYVQRQRVTQELTLLYGVNESFDSGGGSDQFILSIYPF